ncbi:MAG: hypothetical protein ACOVNR_05000, partial [Chitinophagaceae bacterium]
HCKKITIQIQKKGTLIEVTIKDDGKGFNTKLQTNRNGLKNMQFRASEVNGELLIESTINKGSEIKLLFNM